MVSRIKRIGKRLIGVENPKKIFPLRSLTYLGSTYQGYWIPSDFFNKNSICYCVGAGEDISFDTELKKIFDCKLFIFDPTPASKSHFDDLLRISRNNEPMPSIRLDNSFTYDISYEKLKEIRFIERGVWSHKDHLKFYDADRENYVSHSAVLFKNSANTIEMPVDSVKNFMHEFRHQSIDLLKLEIEGAEYIVIDSIIRDRADIKIIAVEFDEIFHKKGIAHLIRIANYRRKLEQAGYVLVHSTKHFKSTFVRKDVYAILKNKEKLESLN